MSDKSKVQSGGIGFSGLLAILFIGLKLTHHIDWPWLWVLSPLWIPLAALIAVLVIIAAGYGVWACGSWFADALRARKRQKRSGIR